MRKWLILAVIMVSSASLLFITSPAKSRLSSYYSGDAISYNNEVYITSTNTGSLEIFKLENSKLRLLGSVHLYDDRFNDYVDFFDSKLVTEDGNLYVYAVSNYTIYKYKVSDTGLSLINKNSNTYWEWYNRVDKFGDNVVTISAKGIKVFNSNLDIISSYNFTNANAPYNISGDNPHYFLNVDEASNSLEVFDRESNSIITRIPLEFNFTKGNRRAYQDAAGYIYVVDDVSTQKFDISGKLLAKFNHLDYQGFDVSASGYTDSVYFSNGVGVVKLNEDMKMQNYAWTTNLGGQSSWAMGIKVVSNQGDKVVVFNNYSIAVLDSNLKKIDSITATKEAEVSPTENLFLNLDYTSAPVNSNIVLSGGGYFPNELVDISFGSATSTAQTDSRGRFETTLKVPALSHGTTDIKVTGASSKFSYSQSFLVE